MGVELAGSVTRAADDPILGDQWGGSKNSYPPTSTTPSRLRVLGRRGQAGRGGAFIEHVETKKHVSATTRNKVCGAKFLQMVAWLSSLDLCRSAGFGTAMISRTRPLGNQVESDPARFEIAALWAKTAVISASESGRQPGVDRTPAQPVESGRDG